MKNLRLYSKRIVLVAGLLWLSDISIGWAQDADVISTPIRQRGAQHPIRELQLKESPVRDAAQLLSEMSGTNIVTTQEAGDRRVSVYLQRVDVTKAIEVICRISGLWYRKDQDVDLFRVMTTEEYEKDIVVFKEEITRVFSLLHENVISTATAVSDLFGDRVMLSLGVPLDGGSSGMTGAGGVGLFGGRSASMGQASGASGAPRGRGLFGGGGAGGLSRLAGGGSSRMGGEAGTAALTSTQIAQLEAFTQGSRVEGAVSSTALQQVTGQAPDIFVTVNQQHNLLIVRTSDPEAMDDIEKLVLEVDRPIPQVLLEMKVLELTLGDSFRSSFDYEMVDGSQTRGLPSSQVLNPLSPGSGTVSGNVASMGNFPLESNQFVYQFLNDRIRARIQLMAGENRIQELATPMILAANNQEARIFIGEERVLTTGVTTSLVTPANGATTSNIEPQTEVRDIGNTVVIVPRINEDKTVTLSLTQDSSSVAVGAATIPVAGGSGTVQGFNVDTVNTARIQGTIIATNNLTIAVGGLIRHRQNENRQKVPLLGDLPVLGGLFRRDVKENTKTELILLVTPRIMSTPAEGRAITEQRLTELSSHPFHEKGDDALPRPRTTFHTKGGKILY